MEPFRVLQLNAGSFETAEQCGIASVADWNLQCFFEKTAKNNKATHRPCQAKASGLVRDFIHMVMQGEAS